MVINDIFEYERPEEVRNNYTGGYDNGVKPERPFLILQQSRAEIERQSYIIR